MPTVLPATRRGRVASNPRPSDPPVHGQGGKSVPAERADRRPSAQLRRLRLFHVKRPQPAGRRAHLPDLRSPAPSHQRSRHCDPATQRRSASCPAQRCPLQAQASRSRSRSGLPLAPASHGQVPRMSACPPGPASGDRSAMTPYPASPRSREHRDPAIPPPARCRDEPEAETEPETAPDVASLLAASPQYSRRSGHRPVHRREPAPRAQRSCFHRQCHVPLPGTDRPPSNPRSRQPHRKHPRRRVHFRWPPPRSGPLPQPVAPPTRSGPAPRRHRTSRARANRGPVAPRPGPPPHRAASQARTMWLS